MRTRPSPPGYGLYPQTVIEYRPILIGVQIECLPIGTVNLIAGPTNSPNVVTQALKKLPLFCSIARRKSASLLSLQPVHCALPDDKTKFPIPSSCFANSMGKIQQFSTARSNVFWRRTFCSWGLSLSRAFQSRSIYTPIFDRASIMLALVFSGSSNGRLPIEENEMT